MIHDQQFTQFTGPTTNSEPEGLAESRRQSTADTRARLRDLVLPTSLLGCWVWTGRKNAEGRPVLWVPDRGDVHAARLIWEERHGPIAAGFEVDHLCGNRACPSIDHFELVTAAENRRRALEPATQTARFAQRLAELVKRGST